MDVAFLPELHSAMQPGMVAAASPAAATDPADSPGDLAMTLTTPVSVAPGDVILVSPDENGRLFVAPR